ncbi:MAG: hypothetical protein WAW60_00740 [Candidatus Saccharimonadales bacterium]
MRHAKSSRIVNVLGVFGYISIIMQWLWMIILGMPWLLSLDIVHDIGQTPTEVATMQSSSGPSLLATMFAIIVTIAIIGFTIYILMKLPKYTVRESSHIVHEAKNIVLPKLAVKKRTSKRRMIEVSSMTLLVIKLVLSIIPFVGLYIVVMSSPPLDTDIIFVIGGFLFVWSLFFIIVQRLTAHVKHVDYSISF